jgi:hypothetical protein
MTGTNCDLFTQNQSRSYLNHLVHRSTSLFLIALTHEQTNIKVSEHYFTKQLARLACDLRDVPSGSLATQH